MSKQSIRSEFLKGLWGLGVVLVMFNAIISYFSIKNEMLKNVESSMYIHALFINDALEMFKFGNNTQRFISSHASGEHIKNILVINDKKVMASTRFSQRGKSESIINSIRDDFDNVVSVNNYEFYYDLDDRASAIEMPLVFSQFQEEYKDAKVFVVFDIAHQVNGMITRLIRSILLTLILIILITLFSYFYFNSKIYKPIKYLKHHFQLIARGEENTVDHTLFKNEFSDVLGSFNIMMEKLHHKEIELTKAIQKADAMNNAKSSFLASMSHELRTPLNAIKLLSETLKLKYSEDEETISTTEVINKSSDNLLKLINDILDYSKIEAEKMLVDIREVVSDDFVKNIALVSEVLAKEKSLDFKLEYTLSNWPVLYTDELKLNQIITNLISNATKFTHQGHVKLVVENLEEDKVCVLVEDTGKGIQKENTENIFQAFEQENEKIATKYGGTGLGLPISKRLAEMLGGDLWVLKTSEEGTTFAFSFKADLRTEETS